MPNFYPYLVSSLPMLQFGAQPPFEYGKFLELCRQSLSADDVALLSALPHVGIHGGNDVSRGILKQWIEFDTALRNELVRIRAARKHLDAGSFLRADGSVGHAVASRLHTIVKVPDIKEAERQIDQVRWQYLDELSFGHYFDLDFLVLYAYKLQILLRWESIAKQNAQALIEKMMQRR